jgi:hypothetical protein
MVFQLFLLLKIVLLYFKYILLVLTSIDNKEEKAPDDKVQGTEN